MGARKNECQIYTCIFTGCLNQGFIKVWSRRVSGFGIQKIVIFFLFIEIFTGSRQKLSMQLVTLPGA